MSCASVHCPGLPTPDPTILREEPPPAPVGTQAAWVPMQLLQPSWDVSHFPLQNPSFTTCDQNDRVSLTGYDKRVPSFPNSGHPVGASKNQSFPSGGKMGVGSRARACSFYLKWARSPRMR